MQLIQFHYECTKLLDQLIKLSATIYRGKVQQHLLLPRKQYFRKTLLHVAFMMTASLFSAVCAFAVNAEVCLYCYICGSQRLVLFGSGLQEILELAYQV